MEILLIDIIEFKDLVLNILCAKFVECCVELPAIPVLDPYLDLIEFLEKINNINKHTFKRGLNIFWRINL